MRKRIGRAARVELIQAVRERYQGAAVAEKGLILDEFVALTGFHRKHVIRLLTRGPAAFNGVRHGRARLYDEAVREALIMLWEASDRVCGKRLKALVPILIESLERHGHLKLDEAVRKQLHEVSPATMDRILAPVKKEIRGKARRRSATPKVRGQIPIRTFGDWNDPKPGYMEIDLVVHAGGSMAGSFVHTLVLTDVATGWTECLALVVLEATLVVDAFHRVRSILPFPLLGIDSDNGGEFISEALLGYCQREGIEFTRSRPHRKNDQAWVEQKNGSIVRRMLGEGRLQGMEAAKALARLYSASRMFVNFFQPSFKLASKTRVGSRITKRYHAPATPFARLMATGVVTEAMKEEMRTTAARLDPLRLLEEIRAMQAHLAKAMAGESPKILPHQDANLELFLKSLSVAWKSGEVRPTHRPPEVPERYWRTRPDPFDSTWGEVLAWLDEEPDCTAKGLFQRLQAKHPGQFTKGQLRTLQRRVKEWRSAEARRLVFGAEQSG